MRSRWITLIFIPLLIATGMIAYKQYWGERGETIVLVTEPVAPRDLFLGDSVHLTYEISNLDANRLGVQGPFPPGERVYVILEKNGSGFHTASSLSKTRPEGKTYIQGRVRNENPNAQRSEVNVLDDSGDTHILEARWAWDLDRDQRATFCLDGRGQIVSAYVEDNGYSPGCRTNRSVSGLVKDIAVTQFTQLNIEYGIERFSVQEGQGGEIASQRDLRNLKVEVSLQKDGKGRVTGLIMGETVAE